MDSLIFSTNAVMPLVMLAALGYMLRRVGVVPHDLAASAARLCYRFFLPAMLFMNIYGAQSLADVNWGLTVFTVAALLLAFSIGYVSTVIFSVKKEYKGVVWQGAFRSNFAILGMPLAVSLFGAEGGQSAAVLSLFSIPLFTFLSVMSLRGYLEGTGKGLSAVLLDTVRNPLIIGIVLGFLVLAVRMLFERLGISFRLTDITFLFSAAESTAQVASPLALIALGAQFNFKATRGLFRPLMLGIALRNIFVPVLVLGAAYIFFPGFYGAGFAALISKFASPVAVAATVMAVEMGGDAEFAGQLLFWSTVLSAVTIFLFVFAFRSLGAL